MKDYNNLQSQSFVDERSQDDKENDKRWCGPTLLENITNAYLLVAEMCGYYTNKKRDVFEVKDEVIVGMDSI